MQGLTVLGLVALGLVVLSSGVLSSGVLSAVFTRHVVLAYRHLVEFLAGRPHQLVP